MHISDANSNQQEICIQQGKTEEEEKNILSTQHAPLKAKLIKANLPCSRIHAHKHIKQRYVQPFDQRSPQSTCQQTSPSVVHNSMPFFKLFQSFSEVASQKQNWRKEQCVLLTRNILLSLVRHVLKIRELILLLRHRQCMASRNISLYFIHVKCLAAKISATYKHLIWLAGMHI